MILSSDQSETLVNWLKGSRTITSDSDKLLYRASRNGWAASNFHSCCDNKGPTVTVVKSGNYIFGGYTEQHWDGKSYLKEPIVNWDRTIHNRKAVRSLPLKHFDVLKDKCCGRVA